VDFIDDRFVKASPPVNWTCTAHKTENKLWSLIFLGYLWLKKFQSGIYINNNKESILFTSISIGRLKFSFQASFSPGEKSLLQNNLFLPSAGLMQGRGLQLSCSWISSVSACKNFHFSFLNFTGWRCFTERRKDHLH